jgi:hypothetical protein
VIVALVAGRLRRRGDVLSAHPRRRLRPFAAPLLELGSGGGNNASHLKSRFQMLLVDRSPTMLQCCRIPFG